MTERIINILNILIAEHGEFLVSDRMGYRNNSQLKKIMRGHQSLISTKALSKLVIEFKVNANYVFTGNGSMFN